MVLCSTALTIIACEGPVSGPGKKGAGIPDSTYILTGKIEGIESGWVYLVHRQSENRTTDSAIISNGKFSLSGKAPVPEFCNIGFQYNGKKDLYFGFFLQNGVLTLSGHRDSLTDAAVVITGSPAEDEFKTFLRGEERINAMNRQLSKLYAAAEAKKDQRQLDSLRKCSGAVVKEEKQMTAQFAAAHPGSYISAFELYSNFSYDPDPDELEGPYNALDSSVRHSYFGRRLSETIDAAKKTAVGKPAPDFTQTDTKGKPVALSSFKGKYVLVDFWASWCGPCRAENPAVVKAYRQYRSKGFSILGVSLDEKKDKWEEAIKKDGLNWIQVSDLKGWKNSVAQLYGINGIPMNYLLDKEGKIIAKGLRGEDLEKKLAELVY